MNEVMRVICGRPFSDHDEERFWSKVIPEPMSGCSLWLGGLNRKGYGIFCFGKRNGVGASLATRVAQELQFGPIPGNLCVRHVWCRNPSCVNWRHLAIGTQADNMLDKKRDGTVARGSRNGHAKITEADVVELRRMRTSGATFQAIATRFGLCRGAAHHAWSGKHWAHVEQPTTLEAQVAMGHTPTLAVSP